MRGIRRDENDALIRLADALCGFVRAVYENQPDMQQLFQQAIRAKTMRDVSPK
jgi:hypothetical protein